MSSITRRYEWTRFNEGKNGMTLLRRLCGFSLMTAIDFFCTDGSHAQHYSSFVICVLTFSTSSSWGIEAETCKGSKSVHSLNALPDLLKDYLSVNTYICQEQPCTIHLVWGFFTLLRKRRSDKITRTWSWTMRLMSCSWNHPTLKPCRTNAFSLENAKISLRLDLPSTLIRWAFSLKTHRSENALESGSRRKCIHIGLVWTEDETCENASKWKRWPKISQARVFVACA